MAGGVGVARVSLIQSPVAVRRGDSASPVDAVINAPVLGGDYVTTGDGARAEVQFDGSSAVRLDAGVQLRITRLEGTQRSLQLAEGTVELRLLRAPQGRAALDTPSLSVRPREAGGLPRQRRRARPHGRDRAFRRGRHRTRTARRYCCRAPPSRPAAARPTRC